AVGAGKLRLSVLEALEQRVLVGVVELGEMLVAVMRGAIGVERGEPVAILFGRSVCRLAALIGQTGHERTLVVVAFGPAIRPGKLTIEEDGAAAVLAARRLRIRRDDAVGERLNRARLVSGEILPRSRPELPGRCAGIRMPRQAATNHGCAGGDGAGREIGGGRKQLSTADRHGKTREVAARLDKRVRSCGVPSRR